MAYNSQAALNAMSAQAREQWITIGGTATWSI